MLVLFLFTFLSFSSSAGEIDQVTLAVHDLNKAAALFAQKGFTLKVPHEYKKGHQKGLIVQSIRFPKGYLQLVAVKTTGGELAKWYKKFLENQEGGATLVLRQKNLKDLQSVFEKSSIESKFQNNRNHHWLSFKTGTPLQNLSFIDYQVLLSQNPELLNHQNKVQNIKSLSLNTKGKAEDWAKILTLSQSQNAGLNFSGLTYKSSVFISEIVLETSQIPLPEAFYLGGTKISFISQ